jgi:hypothetical protein
VVAAIGDLEFLVRHDIREEKHRRRVWPIMTEVLRELLAHSNGCIRRRARHLAGLWLNHHLCFLAEAGDARHEIFATIVDDCPMISLASLAVSYELVGRADDANRARAFRRFYLANRELDPQLPDSPYRPRANDEFEPPERL